MKWLRTILGEIVGLFVDDGNFALAILLWVAAVVFALPRLGRLSSARGFILVCGLAILLLESALRYTRNKQR